MIKRTAPVIKMTEKSTEEQVKFFEMIVNHTSPSSFLPTDALVSDYIACKSVGMPATPEMEAFFSKIV